jgi:hypothetical protein
MMILFVQIPRMLIPSHEYNFRYVKINPHSVVLISLKTNLFAVIGYSATNGNHGMVI